MNLVVMPDIRDLLVNVIIRDHSARQLCVQHYRVDRQVFQLALL